MNVLIALCVVALLLTWRHGTSHEPTSFNAFSTWEGTEGTNSPADDESMR